MTCDRLEPLIEAIADNAVELSADDRLHLDTCERCAARLTAARAIESLLASREVPVPPQSFTMNVMARVGQERWKTERVVDLGFNLALAASLGIIAVAAAGLAWSLGFFTVTIDLEMLETMASGTLVDRVSSQVQTVAMAAVLLTMALVLWWWVEADSA